MEQSTCSATISRNLGIRQAPCGYVDSTAAYPLVSELMLAEELRA